VLIVPLVPLLRVIVPIEQTIVLIALGMAACAVIGWIEGGRLLLAAIWSLLAVWILMSRPADASGFDLVTKGWSLTLAAAFGLVSVLGTHRSFFIRALSSVGITLGVAVLVFVGSGSRADRVRGMLSDEIDRRLQASTEKWQSTAKTDDWKDFAEKHPSAASVIEDGEQQLRAVPPVTLALFPALLAVESLASLALAWSLYHRAARVRIGAPLRPLSEFRYNDQLVWGLVLGVTMLVVPTLQESRGLGLNLAIFFGVLYALRGLGVLAWFLAPRRPALVLLGIAALLAWPVVGVFSLGLGLADTWIDWRGRARPVS
jgi:Predicted membrane protein (DUF2232)